MFSVWQNFVRNKGFFCVAFFVIFVFLLTPFSSVLAISGVPQIMSYQGRLANSAGDLVGGSGAIYSFKFSLWDSATVGAGSQVWPAVAPTAVNATVRQGLFNANIGDTANGYPDTLNYDFSLNNKIYLQIEVSSDGLTYETLGPRQPITSAPFAQVAGQVSGSAVSTMGGLVVNGNSTTTNATTTGTGYFGTALGLAGQYINQWSDLATYLPTVTGWGTTSDAVNWNILFASSTADGLAEGLTNKYYSDLKVGSYLDLKDKSYFFSSSSADIWGAGKGYLTAFTELDPYYSAASSTILRYGTTSDALTEGLVNKFYTQAKVWTDIVASSTFATFSNYWTKTGSDLSYLAGNVSVGTTSIASTLNVQAASGVSPFTVSSSTGATMLTLSSNGNLAIGGARTNSPLQIYNAAAGTKFIKVGNVLDPSTTANAAGVVIDVNGGGGVFMGDSTNSLYGKYEAYGGKIGIGAMSNHPLGLYSNNTERISITAAGLVGLSTTTPNANLNIFGTTNTFLRVASSTNQNIFVIDNNGNASLSGNLAVTGAVTGSNLNVTNWDTAYSWGDWSTGVWASSTLSTLFANASTAFSWGDHSLVGYLTNALFDTRLAATTSLPNLATLAGLTSIGSASATTTIGGSSRFVVGANGNVGIGTANPLLKFSLQADSGDTISNPFFGIYNSAGKRLIEATTDVNGARFILNNIYSVPYVRISNDPGILMANTAVTSWTATDANAAYDTNISRLSAGVLQIGTSTRNAAGTLLLGSIGIGSTTPSAKLAIHDLSGLAGTNPLFTIASSTSAGLATTTLLTVLGNGNVGIGTANPGVGFEVATGEIRFTGPGSLSWGNTQERIYGANGDGMQFIAGNVTRMKILDGGNIGLGTTTPNANLNIFGTTNTFLRVASSTNQNIFVINNNGDLSATGNLAVTGAVTGSNLNVTNWNTAYSWGDWSTGVWASSTLSTLLANASTAFSWGNHALAGYLTNALFDTRLAATTSLPNLATLSGLSTAGSSTGQTTILGKTVMTNASTSNLSVSGNAYLSGLTDTFLSVNSLGQIVSTTTSGGGDVYLANNNNFTGLNTFENATTTFGSGTDTFNISNITALGGAFTGKELSGTTNIGANIFSIKNGIYLRGEDGNPSLTFGTADFSTTSAITYNASTDQIDFENSEITTPTGNSIEWTQAFNWGNHALAGYLTSYTETDPYYSSASSSLLRYGTTSDALTEGLVNKFYTQAKVWTDIVASSTFQTFANYWAKTGSDLGYLAGRVSVGTTSVASMFNVQATTGVSALNIASSTGASMLTVSANGNVGIGTSTPISPLHVVRTTAGDALTIDSNGSSNAIFFNNSSAVIRWNGGSFFSSSGFYSATTDQQWKTWDGSTVQTRLFIKYDTGNVGIGTTTPLAKLDVVGTLGSTVDLFNISSTTATNVVSSLFSIDSAGKVTMGNASSTNLTVSGNAYLTGLANTFLAVDSNGRIIATTSSTGSTSSPSQWTTVGNNIYYSTGGVGIGTTTPSQSLSVVGNGFFTDSLIAANLSLASTTQGSVLFAGANGLVSQNNTSFNWNSSNSRLAIGASAAVNFSQVSPTMASNVLPSPYVASDSTGGAGAWQSFDGNVNTRGFISNAGFPYWVKIDMNTATAVNKYKVSSNFDTTGRSIKTWTLDGSNDNSNWTTVDTQTNAAVFSNREIRTYTLSSTVNYRYYRINVTENWGDAYTDINEFTLGIAGAVNPLAKIHINTAGVGEKGLIVQGTSGQTANLTEWQNDSGSALAALDSAGHLLLGTSTDTALLSIQGTSTATNLPFLNISSSTGSSVMYISNSGNVGIGTVSPTQKLTVNGGMNVTGNLTANCFSTDGVNCQWSNNNAEVVHSAANPSLKLLDSSSNLFTRLLRVGTDNKMSLSNVTGGSGSAPSFATKFNSLSDHIDFSSAPSITGNFSISAWVYRAGNGFGSNSNNTIIDVGNHPSGSGFGIWMDGSNRLGYRVNSSFSYFSYTLPLNTWVHVVLAYDGSNMNLYINNSLTANPSFTTNPNAATSMRFGARENAGEGFNGIIDEVMIYNKALSPTTEIPALFNLGDGYYGTSTLSGLVGGYHLDAGTGSSIADYSTSNITGTLTGVVASSWVAGKVSNLNGATEFDVVTSQNGLNGELSLNTFGNSFGTSILNGTNLLFDVAGSEVGRFSSLGNFGIGTTTPAEKLVVNGNANIFGGLSVSTTTTFGSYDYSALGKGAYLYQDDGGSNYMTGLYGYATSTDNDNDSYYLAGVIGKVDGTKESMAGVWGIDKGDSIGVLGESVGGIGVSGNGLLGGYFNGGLVGLVANGGYSGAALDGGNLGAMISSSNGDGLRVNSPLTVQSSFCSDPSFTNQIDCEADSRIWREAGTPAYAIHSTGGLNYFEGNVGIGTSTPTEKLVIDNGSINSFNSFNDDYWDGSATTTYIHSSIFKTGYADPLTNLSSGVYGYATSTDFNKNGNYASAGVFGESNFIGVAGQGERFGGMFMGVGDYGIGGQFNGNYAGLIATSKYYGASLTGGYLGAEIVSDYADGLNVYSPATVQNGFCSDPSFTNQIDCEADSRIWREAGTPAYAIHSTGGLNYFEGNVGIGTTTPTSKLFVAGASTTPLATFADDLGSTLQVDNIGLGLALDGYTTALGAPMSVVGVKNGMAIVNSSGDSVYEAFGSANTIGISFADETFATSSDITFEDQLGLMKLRSGSIEIDSTTGVLITDLGVNGAVYSNNGVLTNTNPSSRTYKNNIVDTNLNIDALLGLQIKSFNWNKSGQADFGLIAEEIGAVLPELYMDDGTTRGYRADHLPFYLLQIAQRQEKGIKILTEQISSLLGASTSSPITITEGGLIDPSLLAVSSSSLAVATTTAEVSTSTAFSIISDRLLSGVGTVKELVSERMVAMVGLFDYLKAKVVETDTLKVEKGMEIKDSATGDIYCVLIVNGEWQKTKGRCSNFPATNNLVPVEVSSPIIPSVITEASSSTLPSLDISSTTTEATEPIDPPDPAPVVEPTHEPVSEPNSAPVEASSE